jgi:hypothetical protein
VPQVPQIDEPRQPNYQPTPQPSFGDRVTTCLSEGAAAGLRSGISTLFRAPALINGADRFLGLPETRKEIQISLHLTE